MGGNSSSLRPPPPPPPAPPVDFGVRVTCPRCQLLLIPPPGAPIFLCPCGQALQLDLSLAPLGALPPPPPPGGPSFFYLHGATYGPGGGTLSRPPPHLDAAGLTLSAIHRSALLGRMPRDSSGGIDPRAIGALRNELDRAKGCSAEVLALLPVHSFVPAAPLPGGEERAGEARQCSICMSGFEAGEALRTLPCFHIFHVDCSTAWLLSNRACPLCRLDLASVMAA